MNGFSIFMLIFAALIFLAGLYLYTGHKNEVLLWKVHDIKNFPMKEVKRVGKWVMICSLIPCVLAVIGIEKDVSLGKDKINGIKSLEYSNFGGFGIDNVFDYQIICNEKCYASIKKPSELKRKNIEVNEKQINKIIKVLNSYHVGSWNGFDKSDNNVMDGSSFSFKVVTDKNEEISARGYMKYPKNYREVTTRLNKIIDEIYDTSSGEMLLFDLDDYEGFDINRVASVVEEKFTEGGNETKKIIDKETIENIYNSWKDVVVYEKSEETCTDNTISYSFVMDEGKVYTIEKECDLLVIKHYRYKYKKATN